MEENQKPMIDYVFSYGLKAIKWLLIIGVILIVADAFGDTYNIEYHSPITIERRKENIVEVISPVSPESEEVDETEVEEIDSTPVSYGGDYLMFAGDASWYGAKPEWCIGCNPNFIMANGEKLDDTKMTLAFNKLPLGTWVIVENVTNGFKEEVEITDTGGFEGHGKIADLSFALKNALGCNDTCTVTIETY